MSDQQVTKIKLSRYNDEAQVMASYAPPGYVIVGFYDARVEPVHPASMTESEWDAFVAAGDRALGRPSPALPVTVTSECNGNTFSIQVRGMAEPAPVATPLEERVAEAAKAAVAEGHRLAYDETSRLRAYGRGEGLRAALAMVREAGPTVPRAAVEALRDRWSVIASDFAADVKSDPSLRMTEGASKALTDVVAALDDLLATPEEG